MLQPQPDQIAPVNYSGGNGGSIAAASSSVTKRKAAELGACLDGQTAEKRPALMHVQPLQAFM